MRVLNNNNGALTYNRCTACDVSELKCKVGRAVRGWAAGVMPCPLGMAWQCTPAALGQQRRFRHRPPTPAHPTPPHHTPPHPQDAYSCAPGTNGALDGCTACRKDAFLDTVSVKYIDTSSDTPTEATQDYRGCRSCAAAFGCVAGASCDASEWRPGVGLP